MCVPYFYSTEEEVSFNREYPNYRIEDTYVISGPLGITLDANCQVIGRVMADMDEAEQWIIKNYGGYVERISEAGPTRWAFRVRRGSYVYANAANKIAAGFKIRVI